MSHHEIDLLLSCAHTIVERIEAAIFVPSVGETRTCPRHNMQATIIAVGHPYWVDDEDQLPPITEKEKKK